jgi:hypothetical protein
MSVEAAVRTRECLHGVAELVLAGPQYERTGDIRLRVTHNGFGTVTGPDLRVDGVDLIAGGRRIPMDRRSFRVVARAAGVDVRRLDDVYTDGVQLDGEEIIQLDARSAARIAAAFAAGEEALLRLETGEDPVLWPEHFDVGIRAREVNYGVSAGDAYCAEPYAYIGTEAPADPFWNAPFGAARPIAQLGDVYGFFREGRDRLTRR